MSSSSVAVIGASRDRHKFGNKAVRAYRQRGWEVFPIHPEADLVEGLAAHRRVTDLPSRPDRVLLYLPPEIGLSVLEDVAATGTDALFVNPGAGSPALLARARELGLPVVEDCAIVAIGESPASYPG